MTLSSWCGRKSAPRLGRTYSALLASQRQRACGEERARSGRRLRRLSTATTQLYDAPPRAQVRLANAMYHVDPSYPALLILARCVVVDTTLCLTSLHYFFPLLDPICLLLPKFELCLADLYLCIQVVSQF